MTTLDAHSPTIIPPSRRRNGREAPGQLTRAYRRFVDAVQRPSAPRPQEDFEAALTLAHDVMGHRRDAHVDTALLDAYGPSIRALSTAVRHAGAGAVANPALLARAIVLARTLERTAAARRAGRASGDAILAP
jgi:hypothetical protein